MWLWILEITELLSLAHFLYLHVNILVLRYINVYVLYANTIYIIQTHFD